MLDTGTILFDPTISATEVMEQIWAVGRPARSNSLVSAAPQRVLVPHVEVRMTPLTSPSLSSSAMLLPIFFTFIRMLAHPDVAKKT